MVEFVSYDNYFYPYNEADSLKGALNAMKCLLTFFLFLDEVLSRERDNDIWYLINSRVLVKSK